MRKILDTATVPPGGYFFYRDPDSGITIRHPYYLELKKRAKAHRIINDYPLGTNWNDDFDTNVAENTTSAKSVDYKPPTLLEKMSMVSQALYRFAVSGMKVVTDEVFQQRKAICEGCGFYGGENGVLGVACKACGCSKLKLFMAGSVCPKGKWS